MSDELFTIETAKTTYTADGIEVLFFSIGETIYGIEIKYINEIIGIERITKVPKIPDFIKGVINLRGKVIPIISIRKRFGLEEIPYDDRTCIIVLEFENATQVGIIVDRVQEVVFVKNDRISKTPDYKNVNANRYIKNIIEIGEDIKLLLDCEKLIEN